MIASHARIKVAVADDDGSIPFCVAYVDVFGIYYQRRRAMLGGGREVFV